MVRGHFMLITIMSNSGAKVIIIDCLKKLNFLGSLGLF